MGLDATHMAVPEPRVRVMRGYLIWPPELPDHVAHWLGHTTDAAPTRGTGEAGGGGSREGTPSLPAPIDEQGGRP